MISYDQHSKSLVYAPLSDRLVFLPEDLLAALLRGREADEEASTWGEFRAAAPEVYAYVWEGAPLEDIPADENPYESLTAADRFPYADSLMLDWVPADLQLVEGGRKHDRTEGQWLHYEIDGEHDEQAIRKTVEAFVRAGFKCRRDDKAVREASGWDSE